jgi:hypothetical protein
MFIVYGSYHFWPKKVGFRDDYCLGCQAPRRSIAIRTLDVGAHLLDPDPPGRLLEALEVQHVQSRSPRQYQDAPVLQVDRLGLPYPDFARLLDHPCRSGRVGLFRLRAQLRF